MLATFLGLMVVASAVGVVTGGSVAFAHLVGRKMRTEKPLDPEVRRHDLRTW